MKVLKKAIDREDLGREFTCRCGALLLVTPGDVVENSDRDSHYFTCPECRATTGVKVWWRKW